ETTKVRRTAIHFSTRALRSRPDRRGACWPPSLHRGARKTPRQSLPRRVLRAVRCADRRSESSRDIALRAPINGRTVFAAILFCPAVPGFCEAIQIAHAI